MNKTIKYEDLTESEKNLVDDFIEAEFLSSDKIEKRINNKICTYDVVNLKLSIEVCESFKNEKGSDYSTFQMWNHAATYEIEGDFNNRSHVNRRVMYYRFIKKFPNLLSIIVQKKDINHIFISLDKKRRNLEMHGLFSDYYYLWKSEKEKLQILSNLEKKEEVIENKKRRL